MRGPEYIELSEIDPDRHNGPSQDGGQRPQHLSNSQLVLALVRLGVISGGATDSIDSMNIPETAQYMIHKIENISVEESIGILRNALVEHKGDVNFLHEDYLLIERLVHTDGTAQRQSSKEVSDITKSGPVVSANDDSTAAYGKYKEDYDGGAEFEDLVRRINHKLYLRVTDWELQVRLEACLIAYHSPYPEIRAITDPFDDPETPVDTFRMYAIGLFWTFIGSIINNFFVHRLPGIRLGLHTIQLLLYPSGKLWESCFSLNYSVYIPMYGQVNMNPGPWTYKEMMLATIIYLGASGTPYLVYNIVVMKLDRFYGLKWVTWTFQFLLALSTQCLGFGFAGIMRKVCIYPAKALWPTILPTIALNRALMNEESGGSVHGWKISRYSFFYLVFFGSFLYNWIPSFFFKSISTFNWPTWFAPNLVHLTNITGSLEGLGLNPFPSLDWNILDAGSLTIPFYTYANHYIGHLLGFFIILAVYYSNNNWTAYMKINSNQLFNNKGNVYNVHDILNEKNQFDKTKYEQVGPPYYSAASLVVYGGYFCLYPFAILYNFATEWEATKSGFKNTLEALTNTSSVSTPTSKSGYEDPHCKMMTKYEETPNWWFTAVLITSIIFAILCVTLYPIETPIWGIFFTIIINFVFLIPLTSIASVTGFSFGLNVLVELIVGYTIPNSGLALVTLKAFGYNIDSQASNYITDQKLAHYTKLPPKAIFKGQMLATVLNVCVALVVTNWQIDNIEDFCSPHQKDKMSCPGDTTYFFSSVQYGVIGPAKVFSGLYPILKWCFLIGAVAVIPCAWFKLYGPNKLARYFQPTIILGGVLIYAPVNLLYATGGLYLSYIFMYRIKRDYLAWWEKYNYVLTSALSAGVAVCSLVIYFLISFNVSLDWWGNQLYTNGIEGGNGQTTWLSALSAPEGYFGIRKGNFP